MISVVVPVYNAECYLDSCIKSILNQEYRDFELLLINDGSNDSSGEICDRYSNIDSRIRSFHRPNSGVGETRNFGIENANGEWICFIDSDDEVTPQYLSAFNTDTTRADLVISGIDFVNIKTNQTIRKEKYSSKYIETDTEGSSLLKLLPIGFPFAKAYRKDLLIRNDIFFPTDISFHEDHVFVFDCYLHSKTIEIVEDVTYYYKIDYNSQSLSRKRHNWQKYFLSSKYMIDSLHRIKDRYGFSEIDLKYIHTFAYQPVISAISNLYDEENSKKIRRRLLKTLLYGDIKVNEYYFPSSRNGKIVKLAATILPVPLLDYFFIAVNWYQHRKK